MDYFEKDLLQEEVDTLKRLNDLPIDFGALSICSNIYRSAQRLKLKMQRELLNEYNLTWAGFDLLHNLWVWESLESRELAKLMGVTVGNVSSTANTLERKELIFKKVNTHDRRLVELQLTDKGRDIIESLFPKFNQGEVDMVKGFSVEEKREFTRLLRQFIKNFEE